jgi:aspartyl-tRNA(Asn)/glutamyl-tRNA(Gln) amidotransferase subunit A
MVPLTLGSDTNGSIRVPSAYCGDIGLRPTFGRLSRAGSFPFVESLDCLGPMARSVFDLVLAYDAMQGIDDDGPRPARRVPEPVSLSLDLGARGLKIAVASGYFSSGAPPETFEPAAIAAKALGASRSVEIPEPARARAAAYVITAAEAGALHLDRLRRRARDFDPAVRDRLIAGAMIPHAMLERARRFQSWHRSRMEALFQEVDIVIAPATPCRAPPLGRKSFVLDGKETALRPNIGVFTQPISLSGVPVAAVPIRCDDGLPLAVQVVASPWREDLVLRVARQLEKDGLTYRGENSA